MAGCRNYFRHYATTVRERTVPGLGPVMHLRVHKRSGRGGISWDMLQCIKNEVLGEDVAAVELYPPARRVINEQNMRHLWVLPESIVLPTLELRAFGDFRRRRRR